MTYGSISDGSFEAPAMSICGYEAGPTNCPWLWSGTAGVSANNSGFTRGNPPAPSGTQVAFIKNNASMSQLVYLNAGVYNLSVWPRSVSITRPRMKISRS